MFTSNLLILKCVSKVPGHLSKPAAPTSVSGLLRHILLSNVAYWNFIGHQSHHGVVADRGRDLRPSGPPGGLVLAAVHSNSQEEHPSQETDDEAHVDGKC